MGPGARLEPTTDAICYPDDQLCINQHPSLAEPRKSRISPIICVEASTCSAPQPAAVQTDTHYAFRLKANWYAPTRALQGQFSHLYFLNCQQQVPTCATLKLEN